MNIDDLTIGQAKELASQFSHTGSTLPVTTVLPKSSASADQPAHLMLGKHCVVRTYSDGVHVGTVAYAQGTEAMLTDSRRIYSWAGAFTLSEVSQNGIDSKSPNSRLAMSVPEQYVTQVISFAPTTQKARESFNSCVAGKE